MSTVSPSDATEATADSSQGGGSSKVTPIRRVIISVSDKTGLVDFARALQEMQVEVISTGGTMAALKKAGVHVVPISSFTGSPEILDGRVKTLHPKVHAGILYRRDNPTHCEEMASQEFKPIDMVVVNLYPFEETVANTEATREDIIENIDIGGPSLIRAAAKNFASVAVLTAPGQYEAVIAEMKSGEGALSPATRESLAAQAFVLTSRYDHFIADYFNNSDSTQTSSTSEKANEESAQFPAELKLNYLRLNTLRYGENPHQQAAFYRDPKATGPSLAKAEILSGKELSYNNIADLDACLEMLLEFERPFACILKHANPCGAAEADTLSVAYELALATDPLSAFGSIIGVNRPVDLAAAEKLHETQFVECILAPSYSDEALALLRKKKNRRLLSLAEITAGRPTGSSIAKFIRGGALRQSVDERVITEADLKVVTEKAPSAEQIKALLFAWRVVKHTKSNAIVIVRDTATVGIGMGQTSRVDSSFLAVKRAGERAQGGALASDAFFPMPDGLEIAAQAGVTSFIQPGGSKKDPEVIEAANKAGVTMVFTGVRCFRH